MKRTFLYLLFLLCVPSLMGQTRKQMEEDLLNLPEMKNLGVMFISEPSDDEPFYTFKAVEPHQNHLTTLYWFHVYTKPKYEIRYYDIVTDSDCSLADWRKSLQPLAESVVQSDTKGLLQQYESAELGYAVQVKDGKVLLNFNTAKMKDTSYFKNSVLTLGDKSYEVSGLSAPCRGIFVGDIGQDTHPILCMLLENGKVEILSLFNAARTVNDFGFLSSGCLPGLSDIVSFESGGGGPFEDDEGETRYSYTTVYAIDKNHQRHEIELFIGDGQAKCQAEDRTYQLNLTDDWKIKLTEKQNNGLTAELWGRFRDLGHNDTYDQYDIEYHTMNLKEVQRYSPALGQIGGVQGKFKLNTANANQWIISLLNHPLIQEDTPIRLQCIF